jgi:hypothetical protein
MDTRVRAFVMAELDDTEDVTATADFDAQQADRGQHWPGVGTERYVPMALGHDSKTGFAITGIAVLRVSEGATFRTPDELLNALSRALFDAGDVATAVAAA